MLPIAINQMTVRHQPVAALFDLAQVMGCVGVELRDDLDGPLFDGQSPEKMAKAANFAGLRILALAEVAAFNDPENDRIPATAALAQEAVNCRAEAIALIPQMRDAPTDRATQRGMLREILKAILPILTKARVIGLIEPLGFENSTLRFKADVVSVLDELGNPPAFKLIHDTFHHHLADEDAVFAEITGLVHVSGVTVNIAADAMTDEHRVLVDKNDRLGSLTQLAALAAAGYAGPISMEAFAPEIHDLTDPQAKLAGSFAFIRSALGKKAA